MDPLHLKLCTAAALPVGCWWWRKLALVAAGGMEGSTVARTAPPAPALPASGRSAPSEPPARLLGDDWRHSHLRGRRVGTHTSQQGPALSHPRGGGRAEPSAGKWDGPVGCYNRAAETLEPSHYQSDHPGASSRRHRRRPPTALPAFTARNGPAVVLLPARPPASIRRVGRKMEGNREDEGPVARLTAGGRDPYSMAHPPGAAWALSRTPTALMTSLASTGHLNAPHSCCRRFHAHTSVMRSTSAAATAAASAAACSAAAPPVPVPSAAGAAPSPSAAAGAGAVPRAPSTRTDSLRRVAGSSTYSCSAWVGVWVEVGGGGWRWVRLGWQCWQAGGR